jgi:sugar phosphate isomerase/epimerase
MLREVPAAALGSVQLCDAPLRDPGDAALADEARAGRLFPGEGGLPLRDYLDALPCGMPMGVEVPTSATHPQLTVLQRLTRCAMTARRLLAARG